MGEECFVDDIKHINKILSDSLVAVAGKKLIQ